MTCSSTVDDPIWTGTVAPAFLRVTVSAKDDDPFDPTEVTAAVLTMTAPGGGSSASWAMTIESASATEIVLKHVFVAGDVDTAGTYQGIVTLTTPGGPVKSGLIRLVVKAKPSDT